MTPTTPISVAYDSFLQKTRDAAEFLCLKLPVTGQHPGHTFDDRWRAWADTVPASVFAYNEDQLQNVLDVADMPFNTLTKEQVESRVAVLLHEMESEKPPYSCLTSGELLECLDHWIGLMEEDNA